MSEAGEIEDGLEDNMSSYQVGFCWLFWKDFGFFFFFLYQSHWKVIEESGDKM